MKIEVTKAAKLGEVPQFKLFVNDVEVKFNHEASRLITGTDSETGDGIFTREQNPFFKRGESVVVMGKDTEEDIDNCSPLEGETASDVLAKIVKAKQIIDAAFDEKYPAIEESASIIL